MSERVSCGKTKLCSILTSFQTQMSLLTVQTIISPVNCRKVTVTVDPFHVSHSFGFGLMDAAGMVHLARNWTTVPPQHICEIRSHDQNRLVPMNGKLIVPLFTDGCEGTVNDVRYVEHVQARITMTSSRRGEIQVSLTSPSQTRSVLLAKRTRDTSREGFNNWAFMTTHNWGEAARGEWTLAIENGASSAELKEWTLVIMGTKQHPRKQTGSSQSSGPNHSFTCAGVTSNGICIECKRGFYKLGQHCVSQCPHHYYGSIITYASLRRESAKPQPQTQGLCQPCHPSCLTCGGQSPSDCYQCAPGYERQGEAGVACHKTLLWDLLDPNVMKHLAWALILCIGAIIFLSILLAVWQARQRKRLCWSHKPHRTSGLSKENTGGAAPLKESRGSIAEVSSRRSRGSYVEVSTFSEPSGDGSGRRGRSSCTAESCLSDPTGCVEGPSDGGKDDYAEVTTTAGLGSCGDLHGRRTRGGYMKVSTVSDSTSTADLPIFDDEQDNVFDPALTDSSPYSHFPTHTKGSFPTLSSLYNLDARALTPSRAASETRYMARPSLSDSVNFHDVPFQKTRTGLSSWNGSDDSDDDAPEKHKDSYSGVTDNYTEVSSPDDPRIFTGLPRDKETRYLGLSALGDTMNYPDSPKLTGYLGQSSLCDSVSFANSLHRPSELRYTGLSSVNDPTIPVDSQSCGTKETVYTGLSPFHNYKSMAAGDNSSQTLKETRYFALSALNDYMDPVDSLPEKPKDSCRGIYDFGESTVSPDDAPQPPERDYIKQSDVNSFQLPVDNARPRLSGNTSGIFTLSDLITSPVMPARRDKGGYFRVSTASDPISPDDTPYGRGDGTRIPSLHDLHSPTDDDQYQRERGKVIVPSLSDIPTAADSSPISSHRATRKQGLPSLSDLCTSSEALRNRAKDGFIRASTLSDSVVPHHTSRSRLGSAGTPSLSDISSSPGAHKLRDGHVRASSVSDSTQFTADTRRQHRPSSGHSAGYSVGEPFTRRVQDSYIRASTVSDPALSAGASSRPTKGAYSGVSSANEAAAPVTHRPPRVRTGPRRHRDATDTTLPHSGHTVARSKTDGHSAKTPAGAGKTHSCGRKSHGSGRKSGKKTHVKGSGQTDRYPWHPPDTHH